MVITGGNGAGKSTLLELMLRLREPTAGRILIDRQDIAAVQPDSLRAQIGYVPQRVPLLDGTAAENVTIAALEEVSPEELDRAARQSGADTVVNRLEEGWETRLAEGRRDLSHGERQRMALARALLADPPILLLDEPAAHLDVEAEKELAARLRELAKTKAVIIAGDRLPASLVAHRVVHLDAGRLIDTIAVGEPAGARLAETPVLAAPVRAIRRSA